MRRKQAHDPNTSPRSPTNHLAMPPQMAASGRIRVGATRYRLIGTPSVLFDAARIRDTGWRWRNSLFARANGGNGGLGTSGLFYFAQTPKTLEVTTDRYGLASRIWT
jgi:hypothetical protein